MTSNLLFNEYMSCVWASHWLSGKKSTWNARDVQDTWVWSLGWEDPLEEGMATHSIILAGKISWTEEPGGLWSMGLQRVRHNWSEWTHTHTRTHHMFIDDCKYAATKSLQSCPTLCDPIDGSPPGSPVPGILQARTLERVAISFSNAWKWKLKVKSLSLVQLFVTPWTTAYQAPPSMGFSRQEYWSGVPWPSLDCKYIGTLKLCI